MMNTPEREPLEKDVLEGQNRSLPLERNPKDPSPIWIWGLVLLGVMAFLWLAGSRMYQKVEVEKPIGPFFQVTNREMSVFDLQNLQNGSGADFFGTQDEATRIALADQLVIAPKSTLFLYHTWKRLLGGYVMPHPIPMEEFMEFLRYAKEWRPENWPGCPEEYKQWIEGMRALHSDSLHAFQMKNLQSLSPKELPNDVRNAFVGWKNRFRETDLIAELKVPVAEMETFLAKYPNYSRNNWRNIYPNYLRSFEDKGVDPGSTISDKELEPFLKTAFFNYKQSQ